MAALSRTLSLGGLALTHTHDLRRWEDPPTALGAVLAHPRFPQAAQALASQMLALSARDRTLDSIFKDAGRYVAAMCAFYLFAEGELTLPRLKAICVRSRLLSPGRARSLLQFLEHLGYVEAATRGRGGVATVYLPTAAFIAAWEAQLRVALEAARMIEPAMAQVLDRLHEIETLKAFAHIHAHGLVNSTADGDAVMPFIGAFLHHHAGCQVAWVLIESSEDGAFPPQRCGPIMLAALARRFGVSRIHVKRIFDNGARAELSSLGGDGMVTLTPAAREQIGVLYGVQLAQVLSAAARTAARTGGGTIAA